MNYYLDSVFTQEQSHHIQPLSGLYSQRITSSSLVPRSEWNSGVLCTRKEASWSVRLPGLFWAPRPTVTAVASKTNEFYNSFYWQHFYFYCFVTEVSLQLEKMRSTVQSNYCHHYDILKAILCAWLITVDSKGHLLLNWLAKEQETT